LKRLLAHRVSKALDLGVPIWKLNYCCHACDRPACIEPTHIDSKTPRANNRDTVARGRHASQQGVMA